MTLLYPIKVYTGIIVENIIWHSTIMCVVYVLSSKV